MGAGHDGAARQLLHELAAAGYRTSRYDFLELIGPGAGRALRTAYAQQLRIAPNSWGWLLGGLDRRPALTVGIGRLCATAAASRLHARLGPDVSAVLSTYPLASQ